MEEKRLYSTIYGRCDAAGERGKRDEAVDKVIPREKETGNKFGKNKDNES